MAWAVLVMGLWVTWSYLYSDNVQTHVFLLHGLYLMNY